VNYDVKSIVEGTLMPTTAHSAEYVSLRDYIDTRFAAVDKASNLALGTLETRLTSMNEFRGELKDQATTFATKTEVQLLRDAAFTHVTKAEFIIWKDRIDEDIRSLRESRSLLEGKASQSSVNISLLIGIIGLILAFVSIILRFFGM